MNTDEIKKAYQECLVLIPASILRKMGLDFSKEEQELGK